MKLSTLKASTEEKTNDETSQITCLLWTLLSSIQHAMAWCSQTPRLLSLIDRRKKQDDPNIANISMLRICAWAEHQIGRMHCFCQTNDPTSIRRHRQYAHNSFIFLQILFIFLQKLFIFLQILLIFLHFFSSYFYNCINIWHDCTEKYVFEVCLKIWKIWYVFLHNCPISIPYILARFFDFQPVFTKQFSRVGLQSHLLTIASAMQTTIAHYFSF